MKTMKKTFIAILAAVMLLIVGFSAFNSDNVKAKALTSEKVYYFYDFYPSLDTKYENIDFDYNPVDSDGFQGLVEGYGYFANLYEYNTIIIDLKTFIPPCGTLHELFKYLYERYGCTLVFVSAYDKNDYKQAAGFSNYNFFEYLDGFYCTDFTRLTCFIDNAFKKTAAMHNPYEVDQKLNLKDTCIIIDGQSAKTDNEDDESYGLPDGETSLFMKYFMQILNADTFDSPDYEQLFRVFSEQQYGIRVLIHTGGNTYVEPYKYGGGAETFTANDVYELQSQVGFDYLCAIGMWQFDSDFYDFLYDAQSGNNQFANLRVFAMSGEIIQYGEGGLSLLSAEDLESVYGKSEEQNTFEAILDDLPNVDPYF